MEGGAPSPPRGVGRGSNTGTMSPHSGRARPFCGSQSCYDADLAGGTDMARCNRIRACCTLSLGALAFLLAHPAPATDQLLQPGAVLTPFAIQDQHDQPHHIDGSVRLIIFAADMDAGDIAKEALAENGSQRLSQAHAVYIADISGMPSLIAKMFAVPAMRK